MKTVRMLRDFDYRPTPRVVVAYKKDKTYSRVPEAAVKAIVAAEAGQIVRVKRDACG